MTGGLERSLRELLRAPAALGRWRGGAECPPEAELAALAEGVLAPARAEAVRDHLGRCGHCLLLARAAAEEAEAAEAEAEAARAAAPRRLHPGPRLWLPVAAAALLLAAVLPLLDRGGGHGPDPVALARLEPVPVVVPRGAAAEDVVLGYEAYRAGRYAEAAERLAPLADAPDAPPEALLALGSARLLAGEPAAAVAPLRRAAAAASLDLAREARWHLAQAHLAAGEPEAAADELERLATSGGRREAAAAAQLERLHGR